MTSPSERIPLARARELAEDLRDRLSMACDRIVIAGSIRRGRETVKDIELLAIPLQRREVTRDLFGKEEEVFHCRLWRLLDLAVAKPGSALKKHPPINGRAAPWNGKKQRKLLWHDVPVDLFTATPSTWGSQLLIRTGPSDFSTRYVSLLKREGFRHAGGLILDGDGRQVEVYTEREAFAVIGWHWRQPSERLSDAAREVACAV